MTKPINVISLGAGVQSSCLAMMSAVGELPPVDCAIFADTQEEPKSVMRWLDTLEGLVGRSSSPFPIYRVTAGSLGEAELRVRCSNRSGKLYLDNSIPAFVKKPDGSMGLLGRKCTADFKIVPLQRKVRELVGIKRGGAGIVRCKMWIGISIDEAHRMKPSRVDYIENCWPLIDANMSREDCVRWMNDNGFPEPPRSACVFCPFHSDSEWLRLKTTEQDEFQRAVEFERQLQNAAGRQEVLQGTPFLHSSGRPLGEIDFRKNLQSSHAQLSLFGNECEGLCGV